MIIVNVRGTTIVTVPADQAIAMPIVVRSCVFDQTDLHKTTHHPVVALRQRHRKVKTFYAQASHQ